MQKDLKNFIYNKERGFIFAYVPKVACSNWKAIMRYLEGYENYLDTAYAHDRNISGLHYLYNEENPQQLLDDPNIKKLACVREPYGRVLSAYLNKIEPKVDKIGVVERENDHFLKVAEIIDAFRKETLNTDDYPVVNFEVFLRWVAFSKHWFTKDEHWYPQWDLLQLDTVKYDYLGRFENLTEDAQKILDIMGCDIAFPTQAAIKFEPTKATSKVEQYYNDECYKLVNLIYYNDFNKLGYKMHIPANQFEDSVKITEFSIYGKTAKRMTLPEGEVEILGPIELSSFDILEGAGRQSTIIKVKGTFPGPVIRTANLLDCCAQKSWLASEGVPVRFVLRNFVLDLSDWTPVPQPYDFQYDDLSACGIGLYGKAYELDGITIMNAPGSGFVSVGSARGGKKDRFLDSPEALIDNLEIINTKGNGMTFAGPHDSCIKYAIICRTKGKGAYIVADHEVSGASDIDFIHAYATDNIGIDIQAKVKARFLQSDAGCHAGVVIGNSNSTTVNSIIVSGTKGSSENHNVVINGANAHIGSMRIKADAGASGLLLTGSANMLGLVNIEVGELPLDHGDMKQEGAPVCMSVSGASHNVTACHVVGAKTEPVVAYEGVVRNMRGSIIVDCSNQPKGADWLRLPSEKFFSPGLRLSKAVSGAKLPVFFVHLYPGGNSYLGPCLEASCKSNPDRQFYMITADADMKEYFDSLGHENLSTLFLDGEILDRLQGQVDKIFYHDGLNPRQFDLQCFVRYLVVEYAIDNLLSSAAIDEFYFSDSDIAITVDMDAMFCDLEDYDTCSLSRIRAYFSRWSLRGLRKFTDLAWMERYFNEAREKKQRCSDMHYYAWATVSGVLKWRDSIKEDIIQIDHIRDFLRQHKYFTLLSGYGEHSSVDWKDPDFLTGFVQPDILSRIFIRDDAEASDGKLRLNSETARSAEDNYKDSIVPKMDPSLRILSKDPVVGMVHFQGPGKLLCKRIVDFMYSDPS